MSTKTIAITVDVLNGDMISGWVVCFVGSQLEQNPIFITIGGEGYVEISDFFMRDDVRLENIGTGIYGFSITRPFNSGTKIEIFDQSSAVRIWSGTVGKAYKNTEKIEIPFDREMVGLISNAEKCLNRINEHGVERVNAGKIGKLQIYQTLLSVDSEPIYYFQTIHDHNLMGDIDFKIDGYRVSTRCVGSIANYSLNEFMALRDSSKHSAASAPQQVRFSVKHKRDHLLIPVVCEKNNSQIIFVYASAKKCSFFENIRINLQKSMVVPLISNDLLSARHNGEMMLNNSLIYVDEFDSVSWSPATVFTTKDSSSIVSGKNILKQELDDFIALPSTPPFELERLKCFYEKYGALEFVKSLYLHLLQRDADSEGMAEVCAQLTSSVDTYGLFGAIKMVWDRFISSDEFKSKRYVIFADPDNPNYEFNIVQ